MSSIVKSGLSQAEQRQLVRCLIDAGLTTQQVKTILKSPGNQLAQGMVRNLRGQLRGVTSQQMARYILGGHFIGLEAVEHHFGVRFTDEEAKQLAKIPFSAARLRQCKDDYVLFPGYPMTLLEARNRTNRVLFSSEADDSWYEMEDFARKERVELRWYLMRKGPVPGSANKNWKEQIALLSEGEVVPSACEVVYQILLTFLTTGERLFENVDMLTRECGIRGCRVVISRSYRSCDAGSLYLHTTDCITRRHDLGLATAQAA